MLAAVGKRLCHYYVFDETNKNLLIASVSCPMFKANFIESDDNIIYVKRLLIDECKKLSQTLSQSDLSMANESSNNTEQAAEDDFIINFANKRNVRRTSLETDIESEVARFLVDERTQDNILNEYPHVREAYYKYNTTLASSAPVERVFSQTMLIFTARRNRLSADRFEKDVLLKHNQKLIA